MSDRHDVQPQVVVNTSAGSGMTDVLRDFLVDGLGMLLPGFGFLFACLPAIIAPLAWLVIVIDSALGGTPVQLLELVSRLSKVPSAGSFHLEIFLVLVGLAFIVGHLLFRQDIKEPDRLSFIKGQMPSVPGRYRFWRWMLRLLGSDAHFPIQFGERRPPEIHDGFKLTIPVQMYQDGEDGLTKIRNDPFIGIKVDGMVRPSPRHVDLQKVPVEYPYHFLHEYLSDKGFGHLCDLVRWRGTDSQGLPARTKHFINLLKMNILKVSPGSYSTLAKNEAHIRLASSVWYAAHYISYISVAGSIIALAAIAAAIPLHIVHVEFLAAPLLTLAISIFVQSAIEKSLHYQRSREIVFVLHMASALHLHEPGVLHGIDPQVSAG